MEALNLFKLIAGGVSVLVAVGSISRLFYLAFTIPTNVVTQRHYIVEMGAASEAESFKGQGVVVQQKAERPNYKQARLIN